LNDLIIEEVFLSVFNPRGSLSSDILYGPLTEYVSTLKSKEIGYQLIDDVTIRIYDGYDQPNDIVLLTLDSEFNELYTPSCELVNVLHR